MTGNYCKPKCAGGLTKADFLLEPTTYYYYNSTFQHNEGNNLAAPKKVNGYSTDQVTDYTLGYIDDAVKAKKPFFAIAAPIGPHVSIGINGKDGKKYPFPIGKHEYGQLFPNLKAPRTPNWNPANRTGVNHIWALGPLTSDNEDFLDEYYRHRQRALKSVDDMAAAIVSKLKAKGILDDTYIIYSSDNGYHLGNHRLQVGKKQCFEEDIAVPLIIRGPGIAKGMKTDLVSGHVDLAPTILNMAGVTPKDEWALDGMGLNLPLSNAAQVNAEANRRGEHISIEYWGTFWQEGNLEKYGFGNKLPNGESPINTYKALRIQGNGYNFLYSVWCNQSSHELYDMSWDQYQLSNLHPTAPNMPGKQNAYNAGHKTLMGRPIPQLLHRLDAIILQQKTCITDGCRYPWTKLHPGGAVNSLKDAMNSKFDDYYAKIFEIGEVGWEQCYHGSKATLWDKNNENPRWINVKDKVYPIIGQSKKRAMEEGSQIAEEFDSWDAWA